MHFGCINSPKLSSLFVLKQLKHSAEAIKDFDKNFALCMRKQFNMASIRYIAPQMNAKVLLNIHYVHVPLSMHGVKEVVHGNTTWT